MTGFQRQLIGLKLGGSDITAKERSAKFPDYIQGVYEQGKDFIRFERLRQIASILQMVQTSGDNLTLAIVHGAGPFGHRLAHKRPAQEVHASVQFLNTQVREVLEKGGLATLPIAPFDTAKVIEDRKKFDLTELSNQAAKAVIGGQIPISFGDMAPFADEPERYGVVSGDDILPAICAHPDTNMARMVMLCKHQLYDQDPVAHSIAKPIMKIQVDVEPIEEKLARLGIEIRVDPNEKSEGMLGKVKACYEFTHQTGVPSVIVPFESLKEGLLGEAVGTQFIPA